MRSVDGIEGADYTAGDREEGQGRAGQGERNNVPKPNRGEMFIQLLTKMCLIQYSKHSKIDRNGMEGLWRNGRKLFFFQ